MSDKNVVIICGIILFILSLGGAYRKYNAPNYKDSSLFQYDKPLRDWVKKNTQDNALFLIPIYLPTWQDTQRPAFYDANIINAASYNKAYIMDAIKRFQILMDVDLKDMNLDNPFEGETGRGWAANVFQRERYDGLTENKVLEIKNDYGIRYFIASTEKSYSFPVVYQNNKYIVYDLN